MTSPALETSLSSRPGTGLAEGDDQTSDTRQFVTFVAGDEVFAVDMAPVQEIIRLPEVVRVPLAPVTLDGLANLRGKVLPIVSLRRIFGFPERDHDDATRAVVIDLGQPLGFVVDRVASVIGVDPSKIEDVRTIRSMVDTELLSGIIKDVGGHAMTMVLNFQRLVGREFSALAHTSSGASRRDSDSASDYTSTSAEDKETDELQLVSFDVAAQEYAIAIEDVQEIVQIPETIIHVPHSQPHVMGVMTLRKRLLPLVNLRRMFGLPSRDLDEKCRIVVLTFGEDSVGVAVDGVNEVLRVALSDVDPVPSVLATHKQVTEISQICRLDQGKRLVSIITARNLFNHAAVKEGLNAVKQLDSSTPLAEHGRPASAPGAAAPTDSTPAASSDDSRVVDHLDDDEQVVVFRLGKEEFGMPIASVQEIVRVPNELIRIPQAPTFVEGVINLRGSVLPVIDLRVRLELDRTARSDRQRIMVMLLDGIRTGFIVDSVAEVLMISKSTIEPAPRLSHQQGNLISRMANLEKQKRMVQLIDPTHLIEANGLQALNALGGH